MNTHIFSKVGNTFAGLSLLVGSAMSMQGTALLSSITSDATIDTAQDSLTPLKQADASLQLVFGLLLILFGFFLHAYIRARMERRVHITVKPSQKKQTERLFWMRIQM